MIAPAVAIAAPMLVAGGAVGAAMLRRSWLRRDRAMPGLVLGGWAVLAGLLIAACLLIGPVKGAALALVMEGIGALALVWHGRIWRRAARLREGDVAPEPLEEPGRIGRGILRAVLAGPLGMTAAMAVAFCITVYLPGDPRTRIVLGGMLMPVLWGLAMTWTLADRRLLRATAVLAGTSVIGFALAALGEMI